jgi:hypothetical protein
MINWKGHRKKQSQLSQYPRIHLEKIRAIRRNLIQDSHCSSQDSNQTTPCTQDRRIMTSANMLVTLSNLVMTVLQLLSFMLNTRAAGPSKTALFIYQTTSYEIQKTVLWIPSTCWQISVPYVIKKDDDLPSIRKNMVTAFIFLSLRMTPGIFLLFGMEIPSMKQI